MKRRDATEFAVDWKFRYRATRENAGALAALLLQQMLDSGALDDRYEFQPPGRSEWLSARDAKLRLSSPATPPVAAPKPPVPKPAPAPSRSNTSHAQRAEPPAGAAVHSQALRAGGSSLGEPPRQTSSRRNRIGTDDAEDELDMTPMIDMTFLLLIFFMVSSTLNPLANLRLPQSVTGGADPVEQQVVLVLTFPAGSEPDDTEEIAGATPLTLNNADISFSKDRGDLIAASELEQRLRDEFAMLRTNEFVLQANRRLPVGVVREVLKIAKGAGAGKTMVGVTIPR